MTHPATTLTDALAAFHEAQAAERSAVVAVRTLAAADRLAAAASAERERLVAELDELRTDRARYAQAVADVADVLGDGMTADQVGPKFTCGEAETLAHLLRVGGHDAAAETFLDNHSEGDDEGDDPEHIERAARVQAAYEAARAEWAALVAAVRRLLSDRGLTALRVQADKSTTTPGAVDVVASPGEHDALTPVERANDAAAILRRAGWSVVPAEPAHGGAVGMTATPPRR